VAYEADGVALHGWLADGARAPRAPGVLVAHEAVGVTEHTKRCVRRLAELGYVAFALDMYGRAELPLEEARTESQRLMADAAGLRRRAGAGLAMLARHERCDIERMAVVGFCLGGIVALELVRDQAQLRAAAAFHPSFRRPAGSRTETIAAKVLMMVGDADPVAPPEDRLAFAREMTAAGADWQLLTFGGVGHSFTNPDIDTLGYPGFGYDAQAERRSWRALQDFLAESLQPPAATRVDVKPRGNT
jgi:dienelactone hydrolase